ncbi:MAG: SDR family NAD(P)-dependent oxidoreductase, partial [Pseudomonadota bacterium]
MSHAPIALITGAAQGIGLACATSLAEEGHRPILVDINGEGAQEAAQSVGHGATSYACDMSDAQAILALFDQIEAEHGPVATLVNNAGVAAPGDFLSYDLATFQKVIDLNLTAVFLATQRAARAMVAAGIEGAVINMSSINAQVAIPEIPAYCASK